MREAVSEEALRRHLSEIPYTRGLVNKRWGPSCIDGSHVTLPLFIPHGKVGLRLDLTGYPDMAPQGVFWDLKTDSRLRDESWPLLRSGNQAFRTDWEGGSALYIACDRTALNHHPEWAQDHPLTNWRPDIGVARYVIVVADLLDIATFRST